MLLISAAGRSLTGKKKGSFSQFSQKSPRAHHVLAVGGWRLVVGGWRLAVGGWGLVVDGSWQWLAVGGWSPLVVGGWWRWRRLMVPWGALRAVLTKKNSSPLRTPLVCRVLLFLQLVYLLPWEIGQAKAY